MKQRVREAIFNLLGPRVKGAHVVDLFAGTGAVSWEAISRGAISATLLEQHFPTARLLEQNARELGVLELIEVISGDTFFWARQGDSNEIVLPRDRPWIVFCCPPYELYVSQRTALMDLVQRLADMAPAQSVIVVEADSRFDVNELPTLGPWDVRSYPPAVVAVVPVIQPTQPAS
jgi:16S rRNA (guanine966-N2)-methyltransferase